MLAEDTQHSERVIPPRQLSVWTAALRETLQVHQTTHHKIYEQFLSQSYHHTQTWKQTHWSDSNNQGHPHLMQCSALYILHYCFNAYNGTESMVQCIMTTWMYWVNEKMWMYFFKLTIYYAIYMYIIYVYQRFHLHSRLNRCVHNCACMCVCVFGT